MLERWRYRIPELLANHSRQVGELWVHWEIVTQKQRWRVTDTDLQCLRVAYTHTCTGMYCTFIHTCTRMHAYAYTNVTYRNIDMHAPQTGTQRIYFYNNFFSENFQHISYVITAFHLLSLIAVQETFITKLTLCQISGGNTVIYMLKTRKSPWGCCLRHKYEESTHSGSRV